MRIATITATSLALATLTASVSANQVGRDVDDPQTMQNPQSMDQMRDEPSNTQSEEERHNAQEVMRESADVLQALKREENMGAALEQAKGVFLVPDFGRGAFVLGGRGGQGVVLTKDNGEWNGPAFFNFGAVSVGAQGGASAGEVAMLLMTDEAVESFKQDNNFSLNADAGLTLIDWSRAAQGSYGKGDVILWSNTEGLFAGGAISVSNVFSDDEANQEYYTRAATADQILSGQVDGGSDQEGQNLKSMLP